MMIYQNLYQLDQVGRYGNADPHYMKDWVTATVATKDKYLSGAWDDTESTCNFPTMHVVEIGTSKINTIDDPQHGVFAASHYQTDGAKW